MITTEEVSFLFGIGHRIDAIDFIEIPDSGEMSINIKSKRLTDTVQVIVYATYSKDLLLDQDNIVSTFS